MKRAIAIAIPILAVLTLTGCGSARKAVSDNHQTVIDKTVDDIRIDDKSQSESHSNATTHTGITETGDTEITHIEYETALPIDSATGTPPVKAVTVVRHKSEKSVSEERTEQSKASASGGTVTTDNSRRDEKTTVGTRTTERHPTRIPWWIWLSAGGCAAAIYCIYKLIRR